MNIRRSRREDYEEIRKTYGYAREFMRKSGNPNQWGTTFPPDDLIRDDIEQGISYVVENGGEICGVFVFFIGDEPTYAVIENGGWLNDLPYGVVHRVAGNGKAKGVLGAMLAFCETLSDNVRIDTHDDNLVMQHLLEKYGYKKCGRIYIGENMPRIAYQKVVRT